MRLTRDAISRVVDPLDLLMSAFPVDGVVSERVTSVQDRIPTCVLRTYMGGIVRNKLER